MLEFFGAKVEANVDDSLALNGRSIDTGEAERYCFRLPLRAPVFEN
jgi:hypothetical protein